MSWQATSWVIEHSKQKGSALLVMMMIANCANETGTDAWPGIERLARDTRLNERQVRRIIDTLETSGELSVKHTSGRVHHYSFPLMTPDIMSAVRKSTPDIAMSKTPDISARTPDIAMSTDPSVEPSKNHHSSRAREMGGSDQEASPGTKPAPYIPVWQRPEYTEAELDEILARLRRENASVGVVAR